jgi:hypothetical protein
MVSRVCEFLQDGWGIPEGNDSIRLLSADTVQEKKREFMLLQIAGGRQAPYHIYNHGKRS